MALHWLVTFLMCSFIGLTLALLWKDEIGFYSEYNSDTTKMFKGIGFSLFVGAVLFFVGTVSSNIFAETEYIPVSESKIVNKITIYDGSKNDTFYVWREENGNSSGYYVSIKNGNVNERVSVSPETLKVVDAYEPALYVQYKARYKNAEIRKAFPNWKSGFNEVQVPDKYIKIRPGF
jgi:hypothetical protein